MPCQSSRLAVLTLRAGVATRIRFGNKAIASEALHVPKARRHGCLQFRGGGDARYGCDSAFTAAGDDAGSESGAGDELCAGVGGEIHVGSVQHGTGADQEIRATAERSDVVRWRAGEENHGPGAVAGSAPAAGWDAVQNCLGPAGVATECRGVVNACPFKSRVL